MRQEFWDAQRSIRLSRAATVMFGAAVAVCDVLGPRLVRFICEAMVRVNRGLVGGYTLLAVLYLGSIPAYLLLYSLYRLLANLERGQVFVPANVTLLRRVSWCCAGAALLALGGALVWPTLLLLTVAAGFMALIVRVVKNIFEQAIRMKDELDYTV